MNARKVPPPSMSEMRSWLVDKNNVAVMRARKSHVLMKDAKDAKLLKSRKHDHSVDVREVWLIRGLLDLVETLMPPTEVEKSDRQEFQP